MTRPALPSSKARPSEPASALPRQTLLDHLLELRKRLIYICAALVVAFCIVYPFSQEVFGFLVEPLAALLAKRLIYTGLAEAFMTYLKIGLFGAFFLAAPVILTQIWLFISPGLYVKERRFFLGFLIATPLLFLLGAALAYYVVCPLAWRFFLSFEVSSLTHHHLPIQLEARVSEYLTLMMQLIFAFGLSFQLPLLLMLLAQMGWVRREALKAQRKYAFLGIVVIAALMTPPDILSPLSLIIPIYALYELSILLIGWRESNA